MSIQKDDLITQASSRATPQRLLDSFAFLGKCKGTILSHTKAMQAFVCFFIFFGIFCLFFY